MSSAARPVSYRPDLPDWGVYLRPPQAGSDWIHPDDVELANSLIPSPRVFRRSRWDGEYYWLHYGQQTIRVRPTMWCVVPDIDLQIDEQVELLSRSGANDAGIYRIADIHFVAQRNQIEYYLRSERYVLPRAFQREDLQQLHEQHELRIGFYEHQPPKAKHPDDIDLLNVGDLLGE